MSEDNNKADEEESEGVDFYKAQISSTSNIDPRTETPSEEPEDDDSSDEEESEG